MTRAPGSPRIWPAALFALWLLEWIAGVSAHLGPLAGTIGLLWLCGLVVFVFVSRRRGRPALHTWGWMLAVLAVTAVRALWLGDAGLRIFTEVLRDADPRLVAALVVRPEFTVADAVATSGVHGLAIGLAGLVEATFIAATSGLADLLGGRREPARVGLLPRLAVTLLQAPVFLALMGLGLAVLAGALGTLAHPDAAAAAPKVDLRESMALLGLLGGAAWALAVLHLRRLQQLARGGPANRWILGAFALAAALTVAFASGPSPGGLACALAWLVLQVAALRWARPASSDE